MSDVTTINLDSSAAEMGDPRFAKSFDPVTAYIKAFGRRIDAKWRADMQARLRRRLVPGTVSVKFVLRKDGKLMDVSLAHSDRGMPSEYYAVAKQAIQEAADPSADPFPPALENRETMEYTINFIHR